MPELSKQVHTTNALVIAVRGDMAVREIALSGAGDGGNARHLLKDSIEQKLQQKRDWQIIHGIYGRIKFLHQHSAQPITLAELCTMTEIEFLRMPNLGLTTLSAFERLFAEDGLHLGWST